MPTELPTKPDLSSEVEELKRQVALLLRLLDAGGQALPISQFCARNNIPQIKKGRKAPRIRDVGGRQIISPEERDWRLERERKVLKNSSGLAAPAQPARPQVNQVDEGRTSNPPRSPRTEPLEPILKSARELNCRERLLTAKDAANLMRLSPSWLAKARMRGDGPPYTKIGRSVRYTEAGIHQWMRSRQRFSTSEQ